jgi:dienelactone hydrolase
MRLRMLAATALSLIVIATAATAEIRTNEIEYKQGDTVLQGFIAWDDAKSGKRPGVLVIHEWWGHNEHARNQAKRFAEAGYVGFALDMYGKGKVTTHPKDAEAFMNEVISNPELLAARFEAARTRLLADPHVDPTRVGAAGYCFGGAVALAMARKGEDLKAVAAFHAAIPPPAPVRKGTVKAHLLLLEGDADPMVPKSEVEVFEKTMKDAGADIQVVFFPGVKHGFTNPNAAAFGIEGIAYDANADKQSWAKAGELFTDVFK